MIQRMLTTVRFSQHESIKRLRMATDLPSINQMLEIHEEAFLNKKLCKNFKTSDAESLKIVQRILDGNDFLKQHLLGDFPTSSSDLGSLEVKICNIQKYPSQLRSYQAWRQEKQQRIISIGGPAASEQAFITSFIPEISQNSSIHYYCRSHWQANVFHSGMNSIPRHGCALNAYSSLTARKLLPLIIRRFLFGQTIDDVMDQNYRKVDVDLWKYQYYTFYVKNQLNGLLQLLKKYQGKINEHDLTRLESSTSQVIQKMMEKISGVPVSTNHSSLDRNKSMSIQLFFQGSSDTDISGQYDHLALDYPYFSWQQTKMQELRQILPQSKQIKAAFRHFDDFAITYDAYNLQKNAAIKNGVLWKEGKTLNKVFVDLHSNGKPIVCGVQFSDGQFVASNKVHLTLGYKANFTYDNSSVFPLDSINVPSAGASSNFILKIDGSLKNIVEKYNGRIELSSTFSHWNTVALDAEHILLRTTCGGNTGSEEYRPEYFLNIFANTRRIFGSSLIGALSAYGCPRAANYKNSTQFAHLAQGLLISHGKGSTGSMKRCSQAYKALHYLGFGRQVSDFLHQKNPEEASKICDKMRSVTEEGEKCNIIYNKFGTTAKVLFNKAV